MEIIASSVQKAGDFFLHAGYLSIQEGYDRLALSLVIGGAFWIGAACVLGCCKRKSWISRRIAIYIAIVVSILLFLAAAAIHTESVRHALSDNFFIAALMRSLHL